MKNEEFRVLYEKVRPYTMTSKSDLYALYSSVKYVIENNIQGDFVECGVWKGGGAMLVAYYLVLKKEVTRKLYLYDTFEGMTTPKIEVDFELIGRKKNRKGVETLGQKRWKPANESEVEANVLSTGISFDQVKIRKGDVSVSLTKELPIKIALLRLDTDWYQSTKDELKYLYPRLSKGGVLIIDDYGHWNGARRAVDEFINEHNEKLLLTKVNYSTRVAVKP